MGSYNWNWIYNYTGRYIISDEGDIINMKTGKKLKPFRKRHGYLYAALYREGIRKQHSVHRLVLQSFTDPSTWKEVPNHLNFKRDDNRLINLEWTTLSENLLHARKTKKNKLSKQNIIDSRQIWLDGYSQEYIAKQLKLSEIAVKACVKNKTYYDPEYNPNTRIIKSPPDSFRCKQPN